MDISIIAAIGLSKEIGYQGKIPWHLPTDQQHFKEITIGHPIIMGRKTWESKSKRKPFPDRINLILTSNPVYNAPSCLIATSFDAALKLVSSSEVFVIGGSEIYAVALPLATIMYLTHVDYSGSADTYFPEYDSREWKETYSEPHIKSGNDQFDFRFAVYNRILQPIH